MRIRTELRETVSALFGETPLGKVGAALQWLTLCILLILAVPSLPPISRVIFGLLGVASFVTGILLSERAKSPGPFVVIPVLVGLGLMFLIMAISYPLTLLTRKKDDADK